MLGYKAKNFRIHTNISLESLVPEDNFYRQVERCLDLSFVRDLVHDLYSDIGRPSIDPVVFFKLQLIAFFEGVRSERRLMEYVSLNFANRWFIGYDLHEAVPDHSSLTRIRERFGLETFQKFFEHIVELCVEAGLVWGEELYFDSTKVNANAAIDRLIPRVEWEAKQHVKQLFEAQLAPQEAFTEGPPSFDENFTPDPKSEADRENTTAMSATELVAKYRGARLTGIRKPSYVRIADQKVCPTDPDASPMKPSGGGSAVLGYKDHYIVDGGKQRIILSAFVMPASITDNTPLLDMVRWVCDRWQMQPMSATGDTKYGTIPNIVGLEQMSNRAYLPTPDISQRTEYYPAERFSYDAEQNRYLCPQGQVLSLYSCRRTEQVSVYTAQASVCNVCPVKAECTDSKSGRHIFRSIFQDYLDRVKEYRETDVYQKAIRKRSLWTEPLFGEAKDYHRLRRFRLRGLQKVNIEGKLVAAGQNLKHLMKHLSV
jgi:transposase